MYIMYMYLFTCDTYRFVDQIFDIYKSRLEHPFAGYEPDTFDHFSPENVPSKYTQYRKVANS